MVGEELALIGPIIALIIIVFAILFIWEAIWKAIAMWKSARQDQLGWFVCIAVFNTVGILPIVYLLFFQKNKNKKNKKTRKK